MMIKPRRITKIVAMNDRVRVYLTRDAFFDIKEKMYEVFEKAFNTSWQIDFGALHEDITVYPRRRK